MSAWPIWPAHAAAAAILMDGSPGGHWQRATTTAPQRASGAMQPSTGSSHVAAGLASEPAHHEAELRRAGEQSNSAELERTAMQHFVSPPWMFPP